MGHIIDRVFPELGLGALRLDHLGVVMACPTCPLSVFRGVTSRPARVLVGAAPDRYWGVERLADDVLFKRLRRGFQARFQFAEDGLPGSVVFPFPLVSAGSCCSFREIPSA